MELKFEVLRRWALYQIKRVLPDTRDPHNGRRRNLETRRERLDRALAALR